MAKMFYTIEEASEKLNKSQDELKALAANGKLQQFRDRDKLMFKRDQIDAMAEKQAAQSGAAKGDEESTIALADSESDQIELALDPNDASAAGDASASKTAPAVPSSSRKEDPRQATGISVFDAGEVETADPLAQTQISQPPSADEDLSLESVGSGSGLLDLTRESDDTSLGVELDEIYPGGEASDAKMDASAAGSGDSNLASALADEIGGSSGLENIQQTQGAGAIVISGPSEASDPAGSGMSFGLLFVAAAALVMLLFVLASAIVGTPGELTSLIAGNLMIWVGGLIAASVVFALVGFLVGKKQAA